MGDKRKISPRETRVHDDTDLDDTDLDHTDLDDPGEASLTALLRDITESIERGLDGPEDARESDVELRRDQDSSDDSLGYVIPDD